MEWEEIQSKVDAFAGELTPGLGESLLLAGAYAVRDLLGGPNLKQLWADAREIQAGFNSGVRFPTREMRQECWERFQSARSALADASQRQREGRENRSLIHRDAIMGLIREAQVHGYTGDSRESIEYLKQAGQTLRRAGETLSEHKQEMLQEHKGECFAAIQDMRRDHNARWEAVKEGRERCQQERRVRIEANLAKNRERLQSCSEALARQRTREADLEAKIADSHNSNWREKAEGWLQECREKIADMETSLERLERWVEEGEQQLARI